MAIQPKTSWFYDQSVARNTYDLPPKKPTAKSKTPSGDNEFTLTYDQMALPPRKPRWAEKFGRETNWSK